MRPPRCLPPSRWNWECSERACRTLRPSRLDQVLGLIDTGIRGIRSVTNDLRPSLLDDLGLVPALRSLVSDFGERSGITELLAVPDTLPSLSEEAELAVFRALQEGLSNVLRHAGAQAVDVRLTVGADTVRLEVRDDGRGPSGNERRAARARGAYGAGGHARTDQGTGRPRPIRRRAGNGRNARGCRPSVPGDGRMSEDPIRVLVADDHAIVRTGIRHVLEGEPGFTVVGEASTAAEALALALELRPDVAVLDISMPGDSGLRVAAAAPQGVSRHQGAHSQHARQHRIRARERASRRARVPPQGHGGNGTPRGNPRGAERRIVFQSAGREPPQRGGPWWAGSESPAGLLTRLSGREREVLEHVARGRTSKEIAGALGISHRTVETHRESLMRKLQLRTVADLTRFAIEAGVIGRQGLY